MVGKITNSDTLLKSMLRFAELRIGEIEQGLNFPSKFSDVLKIDNNLWAKYYFAKSQVETDKNQAIELLTELTQEGFLPAFREIGNIFHRRGNACSHTADFKTALNYYLNAAYLGDIPSAVLVGCYLKFGCGIDQDLVSAARFFQIAAYESDPAGCFYLGICYRFGEGVEKDLNRAYKALKAAADFGIAEACYEVAQLIRDENPCNVPDSVAIEYFRRAKEFGFELSK